MKTPAEYVIELFGSVDEVAKAAGCHPSRVYRWTYPVKKGGTGGGIPRKRQEKLLAAAKRRGLKLNPSDFFPGQAA